MAAFASSYIKTEASQVTRSADAASMTGTNFSSWYNQAEGTFYADAPAITATTADRGVFNISDNTNANRINFGTGGSNTVWNPFVITGNVSQAALTQSLAYPPQTSTKLAMAYQLNNFAASTSGVAPVVDTSGTVPVVDRMYLGAGATGTVSWNSHIRKIAYYPLAATSAQLQGLTS